MIVCRTNPQAKKVYEWFKSNSKFKVGLVISDISDPKQKAINRNNQLEFRESLVPDILIVNMMLTTGYDVKRLKKMYLLRGPHAQTLLQTISRVNRSYKSPTGKVYKYGYDSYPQDVAFTHNDTIEYLIQKVQLNDFYKIFDDALERISNNTKNDAFSIDTADGGKKPLFTRITENVEVSKRNNFAKNIFGIISQEKFDFGAAFDNKFDFYSTIFEYLIKDYNVASGVYAEYFTPQTVSSIIAKILVNMSPVEDTLYEVYDPSAGSGSLVLHLANELGKGSFGNKAQVYTQDISGKSSRFLRINMLLNGLTNSLDNIIEGDTLLTPAHYNEPHDANSGIKHFDYITSIILSLKR